MLPIVWRGNWKIVPIQLWVGVMVAGMELNRIEGAGRWSGFGWEGKYERGKQQNKRQIDCEQGGTNEHTIAWNQRFPTHVE